MSGGQVPGSAVSLRDPARGGGGPLPYASCATEGVPVGRCSCGCCHSVPSILVVLFGHAAMFRSTVRSGCAEAAVENLVPTSSVPVMTASSDVVSFLKASSCSLVASLVRSASKISISVLGTGQRQHLWCRVLVEGVVIGDLARWR